MILLSLIYLIIIVTLLFVVSFVFQLNVVLTLVVLLLILIMYLIIYRLILFSNREQIIEQNLKIARQYLLSGQTIMLIIYENDKVIWANDLAYKNFKTLLENRSLSAIDLKKNKVFEFKNKFFKSEEISNNALIITDVTEEQRSFKILTNNQPNIGIFQIDNYTYLESIMSNTEFINIISKLETKLINYFDANQIFYEELPENKYFLIFKTNVLQDEINNRFKKLNDLFTQFNSEEFEITFSLGLGINQGSSKSNGISAKAAFNLALTRGGAQIVIFDQDERNYIGGHSKGIKGTLSLKARILSNTISNTIFDSDVVYLFTHKNPDSDAISSVLLMSRLIESYNDKIMTRVMIDPNIKPELQAYIDELNLTNVLYDVVVDKTKKNMAIICDTQSSDYVANSNILEMIDEKIIIDHHQTPVKFIEDALFSWVETSASSTTEMVVEMLISRNIKIKNPKLANLGILGIMTDSSNLQYRTDANTLDVMSYLVDNGGKIETAYKAQYLEPEIYKLKQNILSTIKFENDVAILHYDGLVDDIIMSICVNEAMKIQGINLAVIYSINDEKVKVKIRSNEKVNVKNIIEKYGGGGHLHQAAGDIKLSKLDLLLDELINREKEQ